MPTPLETIAELLATNPHDDEFIILPASADQWSEADKRAVAGVLVEAAQRQGESRAPYVLSRLLPRQEANAALRQLLHAKQLAVRHAAADSLDDATPAELQQSLGPGLVAGNGSLTALLKVARLLQRRQGDAELLRWMIETKDETARSAIVQALWDAHKLSRLQRTWWAGWGLFYDQLKSPIPSIRQPAITAFAARLQAPLVPDVDGTSQPPPTLWARMEDVMKGTGAIDEAAVASLSDDERLALLVFAAEEAEGFDNPRGLEYVYALGGAKHRDLFERCARSRKAPLAATATRILAELDHASRAS